MERSSIISLILVSMFVTAMVIFYRYDTGRKDKILEELSKEFLSVSIDQKLEGTITNIYHPYPKVFNNDPLQAYVTLNDSLKRRVKTGHELTKEITLDSVLNIGCYLKKAHGTDVVLVYRIHNNDTLEYRFQLRDDLGYPLK